MTEAEWLKATDPDEMLAFLRDSGKLSERKARLFACAAVRRVWHLLTDEKSRRAVEVAERLADGVAAETEDELHALHENGVVNANAISLVEKWVEWTASERAAYSAAIAAADCLRPVLYTDFVGHVGWVAKIAAEAVDWSTGAINSGLPALPRAERPEQVAILHDMAGPLPFRPLPLLSLSLLTAQGGLVVKLAHAAYDVRILPGGRLDNARLAVLADALQEAGFDDEGVLLHLRKPDAVHVRGCGHFSLIPTRVPSGGDVS